MPKQLVVGEKARVMLSSFGTITETLRVRNDYLFAKNDKVQGIYVLPENEVQTDEPFVLFDAPNFLQVYGMFTDPTLEKEGIQIIIKDSTKKASYLATDSSMAPERKMDGENLYEASQEVVFTCLIEEKSIKEINDAVKAVAASNINILCKDGNVIAVVENKTTENFFEIPLNGSSNADIKFDLGDIGILNMLYKGIYAVQCKKAEYTGPGGQTVQVNLVKFVNKSIQEADGKLYYLAPVQVVK